MHKQLILAEVKEHYYLTVIVSRLIVFDYFLKEDRDRNSSSFTFNHHLKKFKVSLKVNEIVGGEDNCTRYD
jgi:hypothetical protein